MITLIIFLLLLPYSVQTISRNRIWYDDFTLFTHDVKISYDSAKSNTSAGGVLIDKSKEIPDPGQKKEMLHWAKFYLKRAIAIHPRYVDALLLLGNAYYQDSKKIDSTWIYYKKILKINPTYSNVFNNLRMMFEYEGDTGNVDRKIKIAKELSQLNHIPQKEKAYFMYKAGNFYGRFAHRLDSSIYYLNKAYEMDTTNTRIFKDLGAAYGLAGNIPKAVYFTQKAITYHPDDASLYYNLGVTFYQAAINAEKKGKKDSAQYYISQSQKYFSIYKQKAKKK